MATTYRETMIEPNVTIRLAGHGEATGIAALSKEAIEQGLGWRWTPRKVGRAIRDKSTNVVIAAGHDGAMQGFAIMQYGAEKANLDLLAIKPAYRRRGVAGQLLNWLEQSAMAAGVFHLYVQLRENNHGAREFYLGAGYRTIDIIPGYYRAGESAELMYRYAATATPSEVDLRFVSDVFPPFVGGSIQS